jgi:type II secretory ATPase GspE/PulE/Tfp pilus assembly ATPase PilB-like protein
LGNPVSSTDSDSLAAFQDYLLKITGNHRPSDLHLEPGANGYSSRLRIHGQLTESEHVTRKRGEWIIQSAISQCGLSANAPGQLMEGSFNICKDNTKLMEARLSLVPSRDGYSLVLRFLYPETSSRTLAEIGMPARDIDRLQKVYAKGEGLWLVAGPTGSGKTTTLHTLLHWCVRDNEKVLAIEDPVEQVIPGIQQIQVARNRGLDFSRAVRAFLRQSPDTILIGEIRDVETAGIALQSARTGHRVLSTLHARNTTGVIRRFKDLEQNREDLSSVCDVLIHQRLLPLLCPKCRFEHEVESGILKLAESLKLDPPDRTVLGLGCINCRSGYSSRIAVFSTGTVKDNVDSDRGLLEAVWSYILLGNTDFRALQPYLPASQRQHFTLCQV